MGEAGPHGPDPSLDAILRQKTARIHSGLRAITLVGCEEGSHTMAVTEGDGAHGGGRGRPGKVSLGKGRFPCFFAF